jgi:acetylornithine deacetylase/succinyl-diaminopimelate desuccinylase
VAALGVEHLVATGFRADGAIVGEPSQNRLLVGHKGLEWLEIDLHGVAAHGGSPERGVNAIAAAARFSELARTELAPRFAAREHPLLGRPTLNLGTIRGGDQPSTVAAACRLTMDRRSVPGEDYASMVTELEELLAAVGAEMPGLSWSVRRVPGGFGSLEKLAFVTAPEHPLVRAAAAALERLRGEPAQLGTFPAWTDGGTLAAHGTPVVILGPGDLALAHSPREAVPVAEVVEAARLYARTALLFCDDLRDAGGHP